MSLKMGGDGLEERLIANFKEESHHERLWP